jgi:hypothetical protein
MLKKVLISITLTLLSLSSLADVKITLSSKVKNSQEKTLIKDLKVLSEFNFSEEGSEDTLYFFGIESLTNKDLEEWLDARINWVIPETEPDKLKLIEGEAAVYPDNGIPTVEMPSLKPTGKGVVVMSNIGTALYFAGKQSKKQMGLKIKTSMFKSERVMIDSPRTGILMIGEGLFMRRLQINRQNDEAVANSLGRLQTLFHEARHSDGHGKHLGFYHAVCPKNHDYAGLNACDRNMNGPYSIGSNLMKEFIKNCEDCSEAENEVMKLVWLDSLNRVIKDSEVIAENDNSEIKTLEIDIALKETLLTLASSDEERQKIAAEISELKKKLRELAEAEGLLEVIPSPIHDPAPEKIIK